jgi:hypothetical protein
MIHFYNRSAPKSIRLAQSKHPMGRNFNVRAIAAWENVD